MPIATPANRMNSAPAKRNSSAKQTTTASTTRFANQIVRASQVAGGADDVVDDDADASTMTP